MTRTQSLSLAISAVLVAMVVGWMAGRASRDPTSDATATGSSGAEREILYYRNPMGLPDTSPVPRKDAMGMDYVPVYAGDAPSVTPGTVVITPDRVQALGVRTEPVRSASLVVVVRTSGTVEIDESRQYVIAPRFEGWVERLYANQTGMQVRAGQPLLAVYSPQLAAAQQEYRLADETTRKLAQSDPAGAASMARLRDAARTRLRNWEVQDVQIGRQRSEGEPHNLVLTSPANAVVIDKPIVQGARFEPGETILRLADLSTVWVVAKVPAAQAAGVAVGQPAKFKTVALPGQIFSGEVTFVQPVVDAGTRTVDVRIALPNHDGGLRPGLFGTVLLEEPAAQPVLSIPRSAVLDSGTRQLVLVETAPGRFAPRAVTLGRRGGDRIEVLEGLTEGESVVVAANFLIDAESNLQSALQGLAGHARHAAEEDAVHDGDTGHGASSLSAPHTGHVTMPVSPEPLDKHTAPRSGHDAPTQPVTSASDAGHDDHGAHVDHLHEGR